MVLSIRAEHLNGSGRLMLDGELDLCEQDAVDHAFAALEEFNPAEVFVDLTLLSFIDSTGLRALIRAHQHFAKHGRRLTLIGCGSAVQRVLAVSGVDKILDCFDGSWNEIEESSEVWQPIAMTQ